MDIANLLSDPVAELKLNADRLLSSPAPPNFNNARRYESCIIPNVMKLYQSMRAIRLNPVVFRPPTILTCEIREGPYKSDASKFVHATSPPAGFVGISSFCPGVLLPGMWKGLFRQPLPLPPTKNEKTTVDLSRLGLL